MIWLTLGMTSLGMSWVGLLRVCNSHGGPASEQASAARGCTFAGRDRHDGPLRTNSAFVDYCYCWLSMHLQRQRPCLEMPRSAAAPVDCAAAKAPLVCCGGAASRGDAN